MKSATFRILKMSFHRLPVKLCQVIILSQLIGSTIIAIAVEDETDNTSFAYKRTSSRSANISPGTYFRELGINLTTQYYFDNREFNTLAFVFSAKKLPFNFSLWGFTDLHGKQNSASRREKLVRSFSEYRLSHNGLGNLFNIPGLGLQAEYNFTSIPSNDVDLVRFGLTYKHTLPIPAFYFLGGKSGWLQWRIFPVETDGNGGQSSLIYNIPVMNRLSISGFADINYDEKGSDRWVVEPQLNLQISENFFFIVEYRLNGFEEANPNLDGQGLALGIKLKF